MEKEIKSEVIVKMAGETGNGYIIEVKDEYTKNSLAITRLELEKIVLYGEKILKNN